MKKKQMNDKKTQYQKMVDNVSPKENIVMNCLKAFLVGGAICILGQFITNMYMEWGMKEDDAKMIMSVTLIFLGALFTGLDIYDALAQFAGAGSIIPITGFANSIVSSAMEFKKEGYILGVGAKLFTLAGPVIVYGIISSVAVGLVYFFVV